MKINILTIVLDGMPWITRHWPEFEKLKFRWQWHVVEGVAAAEHCTKWCGDETPRLSKDGTREYLDSLAAFDPRVSLYRKELWRGKIAMVNEPLKSLWEPCLLLEIDSDELWTAEQITRLRTLFQTQQAKNCAFFHCDYRVGPKVRITSREGYGNHSAYEWKRAWRFKPGMRFQTHEPPVMENFDEKPITHETTEKVGLVFRHEAYSSVAQVAWKERYYGTEHNQNGKLYQGAVTAWKRLQENRQWPVDLKTYLPWVGDGVVADRIT